MVDFMKCSGIDCVLKENCYRYKAEASKRQSYFATVPYNEQTGDCHYFLEISTNFRKISRSREYDE